VGTILPVDLFPDTGALEEGELVVGGVPASTLAEEHGTPLLVLCEETIRARARAYREAAPEALVVYGTKAFPNVSVMRLLAEEGLGADVSTLGELRFAQRAGIGGDALVVHGNNKDDAELIEAGAEGALVVLDALEEVERASAAGVGRTLVRLTLGVEAETHEAIRTGQHGSKFGLPPEQALEVIERARPLGLHVHIGSQLLDGGAARLTVDRLAEFAAQCRDRLGWTPEIVDLGGGLGVRTAPDEPAPPSIADFVHELLEHLRRAWARHDLPRARMILEPGRSVVGPAGVTLYRVGVVKRVSDSVAWVAVDGGMSDNPRPQLYGARYTALLANRADEPTAGTYRIAGKHCESGDVLIDRVELPEPRRGDLLAIPATGAYTLAMASNYNGVPRPAAVLVNDGSARVVRRRESVDELLGFDSQPAAFR
jgi:diaminopimelate decarboxylase